MTLAELQTKFQAGILENDRSVLASIADSRKTDRATLFAVYYDGSCGSQKISGVAVDFRIVELVGW